MFDILTRIECLNFSVALKADDIVALKTKVGFNPSASFYVPDEVYSTWATVGERGSKLQAEWNSLLSSYAKDFPNEHAELTRRISGKLPDGWEKALPTYKATDPAQASRKLSEIVLTAITPGLPDLLGGSADLTGSNLTKVKGNVDFQPESTGLGSYRGIYIRYGVREHGMAAIANGIAAYGAIIPFVGTFLNFVSYAAGAVRLAALSKHRVIWVGTCILISFTMMTVTVCLATHDSIGLGEDGPTHQPIETAIHFRSIPNLAFWRPADGNETSAAYLVALQSTETPSILSLSRQNLPNLENSSIELASKGGYVLHEEEAEHLTIVSTGSEVSIALEAASKLRAQGIRARIVSLPCWLVFDQQPQEYRLRVLRSGAPILSLEALSVRDRSSVPHVGRLPDEITDRWLGEVQSRTVWFAGLGCIWSL